MKIQQQYFSSSLGPISYYYMWMNIFSSKNNKNKEQNTTNTKQIQEIEQQIDHQSPPDSEFSPKQNIGKSPKIFFSPQVKGKILENLNQISVENMKLDQLINYSKNRKSKITNSHKNVKNQLQGIEKTQNLNQNSQRDLNFDIKVQENQVKNEQNCIELEERIFNWLDDHNVDQVEPDVQASYFSKKRSELIKQIGSRESFDSNSQNEDLRSISPQQSIRDFDENYQISTTDSTIPHICQQQQSHPQIQTNLVINTRKIRKISFENHGDSEFHGQTRPKSNTCYRKLSLQNNRLFEKRRNLKVQTCCENSKFNCKQQPDQKCQNQECLQNQEFQF